MPHHNRELIVSKSCTLPCLGDLRGAGQLIGHQKPLKLTELEPLGRGISGEAAVAEVYQRYAALAAAVQDHKVFLSQVSMDNSLCMDALHDGVRGRQEITITYKPPVLR